MWAVLCGAVAELPILVAAKGEQLAIVQQHERVLVTASNAAHKQALEACDKPGDEHITAVAVAKPPKVAPAGAAAGLRKRQAAVRVSLQAA